MMQNMSTAILLSLALAAGLAPPAHAIILADGNVTFDFAPVASPVSPALTPQDVRVGRTARGSLTVDDGSRLRLDSAANLDPGLIVARRAGSAGSEVLIDNGAIDLTGSDRPGGVFVHVGRDNFGRMAIRNGGELNLTNPDRGNPDLSGAGLSVGRSIGGGELLLDDASLTIDSENSAFAIAREGATANVTVRNNSTVAVLDDGPFDPDAGGAITVGRSGTANATMTVRDSDVTVRSNTAARIFVGRDVARGRLDVSGATSDVTIDGPDSRLVVGTEAGSTGLVRVDGGARVSISGDDSNLEIARAGGADGRVVIAGGAAVEVSGADGDVRVAADLTGFGIASDGGNGRLEVVGAGSRLDVRDSVIAGSPVSFGGSGTPSAEVIVANGGAIAADELFVGRGASLTGSGGSVLATLRNDGGLVAPGFSPGVLTVDNFIQTAGTLVIEIAGLAPGRFDVLNVLGDAVFSGGTIVFSFLDGFLPSAGDVVPFLTATGGFGIVDTVFEVSGVAPAFDFSVAEAAGGLSFIANSDALAVAEPPALMSLLLGLVLLGFMVTTRRPSAAAPPEAGPSPLAIIGCARLRR